MRIASRSASGVGSLVARSMPTPDHATRALTPALSSVRPGRDQRDAEAHGLVDAAIAAIGDERVDASAAATRTADSLQAAR